MTPLVVQQQGPDEPIFLMGPEPLNRFIARMDEGTLNEAEYIVRCVNSHAALVEASRTVLGQLEVVWSECKIPCVDDAIWGAVAQLRGALVGQD